MRALILVFILPLTLAAQSFDSEDAANLKGINFVHMNVDTSLAPKITVPERMDISDIVELQLRRETIAIRPFVVNAPDSNVPLIEVAIKPAQSRGGDSYKLVLRVRDYVTIDRNKERTIATIFEMQRETLPSSGDIDSLKSKLRELMGDFVAAFSKQNP